MRTSVVRSSPSRSASAVSEVGGAVGDRAEEPELGEPQIRRPHGGVVDPAQQPRRHAGMEREAGLADGFEVGHGAYLTMAADRRQLHWMIANRRLRGSS